MKTCTLCKEEKSLNSFSRRGGKQNHLYMSWCKPCRSAHNSKRNMERYFSDPNFKLLAETWRKNNPEKIKEYRKKEYAKNKQRYMDSAKRWREENPVERNHISKRYKLKRKEWELNGSFSTQEWKELLERTGNKCVACLNEKVKLTQDHIIPLSKGGTNTINNIQPLCGPCNSKKNTKIINYLEGGDGNAIGNNR